MHELDIFGQWLAQGLGHGFGSAVGNQASADFGFDLLFELLHAVLHFVFRQTLLEIGEGLAGLILVGLFQLAHQAVEVEIAQRAVEVIRAAHRTTRLHARKTLHGLLGQRPHHCLIAVHEGTHQHVHEFFLRERVHGST